MDFLKILQEFENTPVPAVLVAGGILFIFLAVGGRFGVGGEGVSKRTSAIVGTVLLILGLSMYTVPLIISSLVTSPTDADNSFVQDEESVTTTGLTPASSSPAEETNVFEGSVPGVPETKTQLILSENQIIMGTADKFQDVIDQNLPPYAVFVIYGPVDENISLPWGGWDQFRNATSSFVENELQNKVQQTKDNHPSDWMTRGINVYRCQGSILNCTISQVPTN